jgi:hypothetical protein
MGLRQIGTLLLLLWAGCVEPKGTGTYYLSPEGDDGSLGSKELPWRTLARANRTLTAGDTVYVLAGHYEGTIDPENAGTKHRPIVFTALAGHHPRIDAPIGIRLTERDSHLVIRGLDFHTTTQSARLERCRNVQIIACRFFGHFGRAYENFLVADARSVTIKGCYLDRQDQPVRREPGQRTESPEYRGDGFVLKGSCSFCLFEEDTVTGAQHVAFVAAYGGPRQHHNIWLRCTAHDNHTNFQLGNGTEYFLADGNTSYHHGVVWPEGSGHGIQGGAGKVGIFRYNTFWNDTVASGTRRVLMDQHALFTHEGGDGPVVGNRFYNNTFCGDDGPPPSTANLFRLANDSELGFPGFSKQQFKNNIFTGGQGLQMAETCGQLIPFDSVTAYYDGNLFHRKRTGEPVYARDAGGIRVTFTLAEARRFMPRHFGAGNIDANPRFVDRALRGAAKDLHLQSDSPCVDNGVPLTHSTNSSREGDFLAVEDAGYFFDGWGILSADSVRIGRGLPVRIVTVDYDRNTLRLSDVRSWGVGEGVEYFRSDRSSGRSPDIGAHEFLGTDDRPIRARNPDRR